MAVLNDIRALFAQCPALKDLEARTDQLETDAEGYGIFPAGSGPFKAFKTLTHLENLINKLLKRLIVPPSFKLPLSSKASRTFPNKNSFPGITRALTPGASKISRRSNWAREEPWVK